MMGDNHGLGPRPLALAALAIAAVLLHDGGRVARAQELVRGKDLVLAQDPGMFGATKLVTTSGAEIYHEICQGCHMPDGKGAVGAGTYPALAKDPALASEGFVMIILLQGRGNMPAFGAGGDVEFFTEAALSDNQIAAVGNYIRSHFGNEYKALLTAAQVKARRPIH